MKVQKTEVEITSFMPTRERVAEQERCPCTEHAVTAPVSTPPPRIVLAIASDVDLLALDRIYLSHPNGV